MLVLVRSLGLLLLLLATPATAAPAVNESTSAESPFAGAVRLHENMKPRELRVLFYQLAPAMRQAIVSEPNESQKIHLERVMNTFEGLVARWEAVANVRDVDQLLLSDVSALTDSQVRAGYVALARISISEFKIYQGFDRLSRMNRDTSFFASAWGCIPHVVCFNESFVKANEKRIELGFDKLETFYSKLEAEVNKLAK